MATYLPNITDVLPESAGYAPNFSFLDTMLRRRQSMYDQGFAQVSSNYNFINRNVTNPYSLDVRDKFLSQAKKNLKDISAMDLSQQQNVEAARRVFEPFVQNREVLMDMAFTAHMDQQEAIAESYRLKDGGKEFSQDNLDYVRIQKAQFANDNIKSVGKYYNNRRSYTPYYDWNKEFKDWFASYKPDKISVDTYGGLYKVTEEKGGATAEDLKLFFSSVASEKAKNQMRIESNVRLGSNPELLAGVYSSLAVKEINTYDKKIASIDNGITLSKDPKEIEQLKLLKKSYEDKISDLSKDVKSISEGNIDFIKNNADKISYGIYFDQAVSKLAEGLSWTDYKKSFTADEVALAKWRESQATARQIAGFKHAEKMKRWELEGLPMDGAGNFVTLSAGEKDLMGRQSMTSTQESLNTIQQGIVSVSKSLTMHVATQLGKDPNKITDQDINDFANSPRGKRDEVYSKFRRELLDLEIDQRNLESQKKQAEEAGNKTVGTDVIENARKAYKSNVGNNSVGGFSTDDVFNAVKIGNYTLPQSKVILGRGMNENIPGTVSDAKLIINGKTIPITDKSYNGLINMVSEAEKSLKDYNKKYQSAVDKYFQESKYFDPKAIPLPQGSKNFKSVAGVLAGIAGVNDSDIKQILSTGNNAAFFYIDNERSRSDKENYFKEIETKLKFQGLEANYDAQKGLIYVKEKPGFSSVKLGIDLYQNYTPEERKLATFGQTQAGNGWMSTPFYPNNMAFDRKGNPLPSYQFKVVSSPEGRNMYYLYADGQNTPISTKFSLTDLIDDAKSNQIIHYERGYLSQ
jgi:hypothetical protein